MKTSWLSLIFVTLIIAVASPATAYQYVIFSLNSEIKPLSKSQTKMLYRGKTNHIQGINVHLVDLPTSSKHKEQFYRALLGKNPNQMQIIWARQSFSGRAKAPFQLRKNDTRSILSWLEKNSTGIAYLPIKEVPRNVNILYITKKVD